MRFNRKRGLDYWDRLFNFGVGILFVCGTIFMCSIFVCSWWITVLMFVGAFCGAMFVYFAFEGISEER